MMIDFARIVGFDWDAGNARKSVHKHDVSQAEAEQVFLGQPLLVVKDSRHSQSEVRFHALGRTEAGRRLHVTFTLRHGGTMIRVISARDTHRREKLRMNKKVKPPPTFRTEAAERKFWETHDSAEFVDWSKAERARFPNLKPSTTSISLRLPVSLLERIKVAANKRDVPYQSLIKMWIAERLEAD